MPDVGGGHAYVVGEAAVAIDADDLRVGTDVRVPRAAEEAASIDYVSLGRDAISGPDIGDEAADLHDVAGEFMADHDGWLHAAACPVIPFEYVNVGSADSRAAHADEHFVVSDSGFGDVAENESASR